MPVFGVICEYDPFHLGHRWMLEQLHRQGPVVCAMSGCFTQRGEFAAVNKFARAEMAVRNGADLVLELPTPWAVSGAERFARGGVELLKKTGLVTHLAFGSECGDLEALQRVEACLSAESFQETLRRRLEGGETFARCRQAAVEELLDPRDAALLSQPNNILAIEYLKALRRAWLTCLEDKELRLYAFIRKLYDQGPGFMRSQADDVYYPIACALRHLGGELEKLRGFVRFSDYNGILGGEIEPKNRVLPLLANHFCSRMAGEPFFLYDRTHREALFYRPRRWAIVPLEAFRAAAPGREERDFRRLWRRFYDTIAIEGRENPRCRMTQMPKRFWGTMTEFQNETEERKELAP